jgi:hypothetical protein
MQIQVSLNTGAADAADIRAQLDAELHGLERPGLQITTQKKPVEAGALSVVEAYQFILDYGPAIATGLPLITAVLQLSNAILQRRGITRKAKSKVPAKKAKPKGSDKNVSHPIVVVQVEGKSIELPADDAQLKKYVSSFANPSPRPPSRASSAKRTARPKKATPPKGRAAKR